MIETVSRNSDSHLLREIVMKEAIATAFKVEAGLKRVVAFAGIRVKKGRKAAHSARLPEHPAVSVRMDNWNRLEPGIESWSCCENR